MLAAHEARSAGEFRLHDFPLENIAFTAAFNGNRIFYLAARDVNEANNTGWQSMGTWTVE